MDNTHTQRGRDKLRRMQVKLQREKARARRVKAVAHAAKRAKAKAKKARAEAKKEREEAKEDESTFTRGRDNTNKNTVNNPTMVIFQARKRLAQAQNTKLDHNILLTLERNAMKELQDAKTKSQRENENTPNHHEQRIAENKEERERNQTKVETSEGESTMSEIKPTANAGGAQTFFHDISNNPLLQFWSRLWKR